MREAARRRQKCCEGKETVDCGGTPGSSQQVAAVPAVLTCKVTPAGSPLVGHLVANDVDCLQQPVGAVPLLAVQEAPLVKQQQAPVLQGGCRQRQASMWRIQLSAESVARQTAAGTGSAAAAEVSRAGPQLVSAGRQASKQASRCKCICTRSTQPCFKLCATHCVAATTPARSLAQHPPPWRPACRGRPPGRIL